MLKEKPLTGPINKDLTSLGNFYTNSIQFDDFMTNSLTLNTKNYSVFPLIGANSYTDDSYVNYKSFINSLSNSSNILINTNFKTN